MIRETSRVRSKRLNERKRLDFVNQELVVVTAFCGDQFPRSIEHAMKPAKQTELMDEDDNLSRNSRCSWW
jgi:hypothetical protein